MRPTYLLHIAAGMLALLAGYVALYAPKGARVHRRSGIVFVYAMLVMAAGGVTMAVLRGVAPAINVPAGLLTACLVISALTTVRPPFAGSRWLDRGVTVVSLGVGVAGLVFGVQAIAGGGARNGMPAFPFLMFGVVGLLAAAGDLRVMRSGALRGAPRLARHLWRMSFALFIAALSFFIGQAQVFPKPVRTPALLVLPVLAVLVTMLYWLWGVRPAGGARSPTAADRGQKSLA